MNSERIRQLLDAYAAHFPEEGGVPERLQTLWDAAAQCASTFDPQAESLTEMLHHALDAAAPLLNYAGSVQPLNGLLCLAEKEPAALRQALETLLATDQDTLVYRQLQMQAYCDSCTQLLHIHAPGKRGWEQNLRAAITLLALIRPAENYLYKSTEARYVSDMIGYRIDVSSGPAFTLGGYYAMCGVLAEAAAQHEVLSTRIPAMAALSNEALIRLMIGDLLLNAGPRKLALFGNAEPLIHSRSRAGNTLHERMMQISRLQLDLATEQRRLAAVEAELSALPVPELAGQRFRSPAFGDAVALRTQGNILIVEAGGSERRLSMPACFLQGHLIPEEETLTARYEHERELLSRRKQLSASVIDLQCSISRLQQKP